MYAMSEFEPTPPGPRPAPRRRERNESARDNADRISSLSQAFCHAYDRIARVAPTRSTVLITGETGTGKELAARAVHRCSQRAGHPLVALNVGAIPETLISSELFGHEHGAFTGAVQRRIGRFEQADRATLFLDEIGELSKEMQVALLRVLQEGEFERLGSSQTRRVDIRLIAATHRDLEEEVAKQRFRADLYYRLNVFPVHLPALRERAEDIPALVHDLLRQTERKIGRQFTGVQPESLARMQAFSWPGNIRQLENIVEQSAILCDGPLLEIPAGLLDEPPARKPGSRLDAVLKENEQQLIADALAAAGGRVSGLSGAAARLGLPPSTLESKIRRYNIDKQRYRFGRS